MLRKLTLMILVDFLNVASFASCTSAAPPTSTAQPTAVQTIVVLQVPTITLTITLTPSPSPEPTEILTPSPTLEPTAVGEELSLVLWDLSHGPRQSETGVMYELDGLYSQLKSELEEQEISLIPNRDPLEQVDLSKYVMIVIAMTSSEKQNYTAAEAEIIGKFVKQGGSLLILAENPGFPNRIRNVIGYYNIEIGQDIISGEVTRLEDHPIFKGVNTISFLLDGCSLIVKNDQARVVASQDSLAAIVLIENLPGRVVVVGDSNLFDNRVLSRNRQLAINLFRWLTER